MIGGVFMFIASLVIVGVLLWMLRPTGRTSETDEKESDDTPVNDGSRHPVA